MSRSTARRNDPCGPISRGQAISLMRSSATTRPPTPHRRHSRPPHRAAPKRHPHLPMPPAPQAALRLRHPATIPQVTRTPDRRPPMLTAMLTAEPIATRRSRPRRGPPARQRIEQNRPTGRRVGIRRAGIHPPSIRPFWPSRLPQRRQPPSRFRFPSTPHRQVFQRQRRRVRAGPRRRWQLRRLPLQQVHKRSDRARLRPRGRPIPIRARQRRPRRRCPPQASKPLLRWHRTQRTPRPSLRSRGNSPPLPRTPPQ